MAAGGGGDGFIPGGEYFGRDARDRAAGSGPVGEHYPYARQVRVGWCRDTKGNWTSETVDPRLWEVFCQECGDTDGPSEYPAASDSKVRGPYSGKRRAVRAARRHFAEFRN
jgi:hypothetical protein